MCGCACARRAHTYTCRSVRALPHVSARVRACRRRAASSAQVPTASEGSAPKSSWQGSTARECPRESERFCSARPRRSPCSAGQLFASPSRMPCTVASTLHSEIPRTHGLAGRIRVDLSLNTESRAGNQNAPAVQNRLLNRGWEGLARRRTSNGLLMIIGPTVLVVTRPTETEHRPSSPGPSQIPAAPVSSPCAVRIVPAQGSR